MALTLVKLPVQSKDDEQACYLQQDGFPAKVGGVPVLQHCVVVQPKHLKKWVVQDNFMEVVAKGDKSNFEYDNDKNFKHQLLASGEAFVDLDNFSGPYDPVFMSGGVLKIDPDNYVAKTNDPKQIVVYKLEGGTLQTFVLNVESRGFGMGDMGAARTDRESEIEYYWWGNKAFGYAIGFDLSRHRAISPERFVPEVKTENGTFYRCCDPGIAHAANTLTVYPTDAEAVIYKRFKGETDHLYSPDANVSDSGLKRKKKNRPYQPDGVRLVRLLTQRDGVPTSYKTQVAKKRKGRDYVMQGKSIVKESEVGVAAGIEIGKSGIKRGTMPKTPTARANELLKKEEASKFVLSRGVQLDGGKVRTDQEWCHLLATSLRGQEEYYNFVLGSKHCNSEQLAIESALLFSLEAVRTAKRELKVKITAYVVPGTEDLLGEVIRYKVLMTAEEDGDDDRLLLDHLIDAQSESLSYLEYRVLHETVRRVVALELGDDQVKAYENRLNARIKERHAVDKKGEGLEYEIDKDLKDELFVPGEEEDEEMGDETAVPWLRSKGPLPSVHEVPDEEEAEDVEMG